MGADLMGKQRLDPIGRHPGPLADQEIPLGDHQASSQARANLNSRLDAIPLASVVGDLRPGAAGEGLRVHATSARVIARPLPRLVEDRPCSPKERRVHSAEHLGGAQREPRGSEVEHEADQSIELVLLLSKDLVEGGVVDPLHRGVPHPPLQSDRIERDGAISELGCRLETGATERLPGCRRVRRRYEKQKVEVLRRTRKLAIHDPHGAIDGSLSEHVKVHGAATRVVAREAVEHPLQTPSEVTAQGTHDLRILMPAPRISIHRREFQPQAEDAVRRGLSRGQELGCSGPSGGAVFEERDGRLALFGTQPGDSPDLSLAVTQEVSVG